MRHITLSQYLTKYDSHHSHAITPYIQAMASSAKCIRTAIAHASIQGIYGATGTINIHGEAVQHLDILSDTTCIDNLKACGVIAGVVSEEHSEVVAFKSSCARYVAVIDPLDGSSNIDTNNTIGTIFSLFERTSPDNEEISSNDFLQNGASCICGGYIAYGPATMLVYTVGNGVHVFTYSCDENDFILVNDSLQMPKQGSSYAINEAYLSTASINTQHYIAHLKEQSSHSLRYVGSLVADIHRILSKGGIFIYPTQYDKGKKKDKLRLLCECIPIAFLIEQAGGIATDGITPILSLTPRDIHEKSALYCGSIQEMQEYNTYATRY